MRYGKRSSQDGYEIGPIIKALEPLAEIPERPGWAKMNCPFHGDRHASASVNHAEKVFRCHACKVRGNAVQVVMKAKEIGYAEAVRYCQDHSGGEGAAVPRRAAKRTYSIYS